MVTLKPSIFSDPCNVPAIGLDPRFAGLVRLAALGYRGKSLETRGFVTAYRGPLVILATSGDRTADDPMLGRCFARARRELADDAVPGDIFDRETRRSGFALVLATVTQCRRLVDADWPRAFFPPDPEKPRFAWELTNLWPLAPFPARAGQLFTRIPLDFVIGGLANDLAHRGAFGGDRIKIHSFLQNGDPAGLGAERLAA